MTRYALAESGYLTVDTNIYFSDLKPKIALNMLPGLPGYVLFMMVRYTDYINNDEMVRSLIQGAITLIKKVVKKKGQNDLEVRKRDSSKLFRDRDCSQSIEFCSRSAGCA